MPLRNARLVELPLHHPWRISRGGIAASAHVFVDLEWEGVVGHGVAVPS